jgi:anti-anti-sigma factor
MAVTLKVSKKHATVAVDGGCTVTEAAELKKALQSAIEKSPKVALDFSRITAIDVSSLQLVCAAYRNAQTSNVDMEFSSLNKTVISTIEELGFNRHMPCAFDKRGLCLLCMSKRPKGSS